MRGCSLFVFERLINSLSSQKFCSYVHIMLPLVYLLGLRHHVSDDKNVIIVDFIKVYFDFRNTSCVLTEFGSYAARNMFP